MDIISHSDVETFICVNMPPDAVIAGCTLKKLFPHIKFVVYFLDPFSPQNLNPFLSDERYRKKRDKTEKNILESADCVVAQLEHEKYYLEHYGDKYKEKIEFLGVPLLENRIDKDFCFRKNEPYMVFAGAVSESYRDPRYIIDVFKYVNHVKLVMYITNGTKWLQDYILESNNNNVTIYDRIPKNELESVLANADGFVNIGNSLALYAPSKIIEYE